MTYDFSYLLEASFDAPIVRHAYALQIVPRPTPFYTIEHTQLFFPPHETTYDGFGNRIDFGFIQEPHTLFRAHLLATAVFKGAYECHDQDYFPFLAPTQLTSTPYPLHHLKSSLLDPYEITQNLTHKIFSSFLYQKGVTTPQCSITTLLEEKKGVCQDFAHLLIALLRQHKIAARYVVGFISGEGESHAWVEAYIGGRWLGFDPTHDTMITHQPYIKVAHGRDAHDCLMNRGLFLGSVTHSLCATVTMNQRS